MNVVLVVAAIAAAWLASALVKAFRSRAHRRELEQQLTSDWGKEKEPDRFPRAPGVLHRDLTGKGQPSLDAQTWSDLHLARMFAFLDRCESVLGREVLHDRLRRCNHDPEELATFDALVEKLRLDESFRNSIQRPLASIGGIIDASFWDFVIEPRVASPEWLAIFPVLTVLSVLFLAGSLLAPACLWAVGAILLLGFFLRTRIGVQLTALKLPLRGAGCVLDLARAVKAPSAGAMPGTPDFEATLASLSRLSRLVAWIGRDEYRADPLGVLWEYVNFLFCVDGFTYWLVEREVARRTTELRAVATHLGGLDAALSIASVRTSVPVWCRPRFVDAASGLTSIDLHHPLVTDCVPNSVELSATAGMLLTGANMTGKSTLLRSVGTTCLTAQSLCTAFARSHAAPWLAVRSCISPSDDLQGGKSLYEKEAELIVSMMADAALPGTSLCLFDEMFRGTNTVDRISAAESVLRYLIELGSARGSSSRCLVMAATHDLELVPMLADTCAAFHFGDGVDEHGLTFDFKLHAGPTTSRNAITLLEHLHAPPEVVSRAFHNADGLSKSG